MSEVTMYQELQNNIFEFYKGITGRKINDPDSKVYEQIRNIATSFISDKEGFIYDERHTENSFRWTVCKDSGEFIVGKIKMEENDGAYLVSSFSVKTDDGTDRKNFARSMTLPWNQYNHWRGMRMFAKEIKQKYPKKTVWLYTGYNFEDIKNLEILKYVDVLCDGRFVLEKRDTQAHWVGSTNQRVIDVQQSLKNEKVILHI